MNSVTKIAHLLLAVTGAAASAQAQQSLPIVEFDRPLLPHCPQTGGIELDPEFDGIGYETILGIAYDHVAKNYGSCSYWEFGYSAAFGDFDGDGETDLAIGIRVSGDYSDVVSPDDPTAASTQAANVKTRTGAGAVCVLYGPFNEWVGKKRVGSAVNDTLSPADGWINAFDFDSMGISSTDKTNRVGNPIESLIIFSDTPRLESYANANVSGAIARDAFTDDDDEIINPTAFEYDGTPVGGTGNIKVNAWNASPATDNTANWEDPNASGNSADGVVGDGFGYSISFVGDVDNDGRDDLLIGAPNYNRWSERNDQALHRQYFGTGVGEVYYPQTSFGMAALVFGEVDGTNRLTGVYSVDDIGRADEGHTLEGVRFYGAEIHTKVGQDVRNGSLRVPDDSEGAAEGATKLLDINGDSYADFLIGAQSFDIGSHPHFDNLDDLDISNDQSSGHLVNPTSTNPGSDPGRLDTGVGACFILYGKHRNDWQSSYELPDAVSEFDPGETSTETTSGAVIYGYTGSGYLGYCGFAGDFDGNGYADVIIGAPHEDYAHSSSNGSGSFNNAGHSGTGAAYIVFGYEGSDAPLGEYFTNPNGASFDQSSGMPHHGIDLSPIYRQVVSTGGAQRPVAIKLIGNINKNIDYPNSSGHPGFDSQFGWNQPWSYGGESDTLAQLVSNQEIGPEFGWSVMAAGDVNDDGFAEVLIGAPDFLVGTSTSDNGVNYRSGSSVINQPDSTGRVYMVFGFVPPNGDDHGNGLSAGLYEYEMDDLVSKINPTASEARAIVIRGEHIGDNFGYHVFCAGDVNNDEYADFVIGANAADLVVDLDDDTYEDVVPSVGAAYLIYGGPELDPADPGHTAVSNFSAQDIGKLSFPGLRIYGDKYIQKFVSTGDLFTAVAGQYRAQAFNSNDTPDKDHDAYKNGGGKALLGTWVFGGVDLNADEYDDFGFCAPNASVWYESNSIGKIFTVGGVYVFFGGNMLVEGDLDNNGVLNSTDVAIYNSLRSFGVAPDLTNDGVVTDEDVDYLEEFVSP